MERELQELELRLMAHRVLLAGMLGDAMLSDEALQALRRKLHTEGLNAGLRARYPDAADAFFDEMGQLLQLVARKGYENSDGSGPAA